MMLTPAGIKKECHIFQQKIRFFADMVYLQNMYAQQNEQQNHADHARWERKRKKLFDNLRNPANRKDNSYLCNDFQVLISSFDPVLPLKAGSAAYLYHLFRLRKQVFRVFLHYITPFELISKDRIPLR